MPHVYHGCVRVLEAPNARDGSGPSLLLASGVTGCVDWQAALVARLAAPRIPRRLSEAAPK
jgi:hypothetical protein